MNFISKFSGIPSLPSRHLQTYGGWNDYDHFSPLVIMQLEDYGFCGIGEGGPFVGDGHIRWKSGSIPVNTHGGNLSEAYIIGMTHVREAVEQLRGTAVNQVDGAEIALVTGGPAALPVSGTLLRR